MRAYFRSTFQSLQVRNYRLFATGQLVSLIFGWVQITAQDWLVLQLSHSSPTALGVVTALQFTPVLLFTLYAGTLADRFDKRLLLVIVNSVWLGLSGLMAVLVLSGTVTLWQVYVFAALWGTVSALETPVRQSFVSEMVGGTLLPNALALSSATFNTARIIGPALAGVLIAVLGTGSAFLVNAASYVFPLVALSRMRPAELYRADRTVRVSAADARVVDGLRYVSRRPDLLFPIALMLVIGMLGFNYQLTLAVLAKNVFHTGAATFGLLTTALATGALAGALAATRRRARPSVWVVLGASIGFGVLGVLVGHHAHVRVDRARPGTHRLLADLSRPGCQPAGPARGGPRGTRPGDGALRPGVPGYQPDRRATGRLAGRDLRPPGEHLAGRGRLAGGQPGGLGLAAAPGPECRTPVAG